MYLKSNMKLGCRLELLQRYPAPVATSTSPSPGTEAWPALPDRRLLSKPSRPQPKPQLREKAPPKPPVAPQPPSISKNTRQTPVLKAKQAAAPSMLPLDTNGGSSGGQDVCSIPYTTTSSSSGIEEGAMASMSISGQGIGGSDSSALRSGRSVLGSGSNNTSMPSTSEQTRNPPSTSRSHPRPGSTPTGVSAPAGGALGRAPAPPPSNRVLGVDFGMKWTGLAVGIHTTCDALQMVAPAAWQAMHDASSQRLVIPSGNSTSDLARRLVQLCEDKALTGIVVGLPLNPMLNGCLTNPETDTHVARRCRSLANTVAILAAAKGLEVYLYDEASTSSDARRLMRVSQTERLDGFNRAKDKKTHQEDALSAMMLVRRYLNSPGRAVRVRLRGQAQSPRQATLAEDEAN